MKDPNPQVADYFRLRAEWLRFKNHVFDASTGLPTLAAVMDDVRRLLEERGSLGVVYFDLAVEPGREAARGWQASDELLRAFAQALLALRGGGGPLSPPDIVAVLSVRSDKFIVFMRAGERGGVDSTSMAAQARRLTEKLAATLPEFLHSARGGPVPWHEGHAVMYRDPMLRAERSMHRALDEAMFMSLTQRTHDDDRRLQGLDEIIGEEEVVTLYQPILDLRTLDVLGHEVFSRGPAGGPFEDAERLFALAERTGRLLELERLCRNRALVSAPHHLRPGTKLFLNTSAPALADPEVSGEAFLRQVEEQGLDHGDVVLEITERVALEERQAFRDMLRKLKREGFGIAIDDMGSGYSSLKALVEVEPDYLKFDISLVHDIDRSLIKRSLLETLVELSAKIGARVIAEGIEMEPELATLREMGVPLGQGRFLGPPVLVGASEKTATP